MNATVAAGSALGVLGCQPAMTLVSDDGARVNVAEVAGDKLILVFFRGHW